MELPRIALFCDSNLSFLFKIFSGASEVENIRNIIVENY